MRLRLSALLILLAMTSSCGTNPQNYKPYKLPSGKEIKVTSMGKMDFPEGNSALVMNYLTDVSIENKTALRKEVDEIWVVFQNEVESAHLKAAAIRATHVEGTGFVKTGNGYGFVFVKRDDGKWYCTDDEKQQTK